MSWPRFHLTPSNKLFDRNGANAWIFLYQGQEKKIIIKPSLEEGRMIVMYIDDQEYIVFKNQ